jgi:hypothetical protein
MEKAVRDLGPDGLAESCRPTKGRFPPSAGSDRLGQPPLRRNRFHGVLMFFNSDRRRRAVVARNASCSRSLVGSTTDFALEPLENLAHGGDLAFELLHALDQFIICAACRGAESLLWTGEADAP